MKPSYRVQIDEHTYTERHTSITVEGQPGEPGLPEVQGPDFSLNPSIQAPLTPSNVNQSGSSSSPNSHDGETGIAVVQKTEDLEHRTETELPAKSAVEYGSDEEDEYASPGHPQVNAEDIASTSRQPAQGLSGPPLNSSESTEHDNGSYDDEYTSPGGVEPLSYEQDLPTSAHDQQSVIGAEVPSNDPSDDFSRLSLDGGDEATSFDAQAHSQTSYEPEEFERNVSEDLRTDDIIDTPTAEEIYTNVDDKGDVAGQVEDEGEFIPEDVVETDDPNDSQGLDGESYDGEFDVSDEAPVDEVDDVSDDIEADYQEVDILDDIDDADAVDVADE